MNIENLTLVEVRYWKIMKYGSGDKTDTHVKGLSA
jgi:hypothetical protein